MQDDTNDLLLQELRFISWDIIYKDIMLLKKELEKLIVKDNSIQNVKRIEIDFLIRALEHDIKNDIDINPDDAFKRVLTIKKTIKG